MIIQIGVNEYKRCYGNKFVRMGDPQPYFDLLHPLKMAPIPMYKHEAGTMIKFIVPCQITVERVAPNADIEYQKIKKKDIEDWKYLKEKIKQWAIEDAAKKLELSKCKQKQGIDTHNHIRLATPFMERFRKHSYNRTAGIS